MTPAKLHRLSWLLYDFANNSFSMMIVTFAYLSPLLGAVADLSGGKKKFLVASGLLCILLTSQLSWVGPGMVFWGGMALFVLANIVYQTGQVFYNAFLPELASLEELGRLSDYGWPSACSSSPGCFCCSGWKSRSREQRRIGMSAKEPTIRVTMLPRDTNARGTIFGGVILSHIDLAGALAARQHALRNFVTKAMHEVDFIAPVYVGDVVSFYAAVVREGRTSVTIRVEVEAERFNKPGERVKVTEAEVVYVATDEKGRATPIR